MEIIPDPMVAVLQLIPFAVTLFALYKIILSPMLDYLDERQATINRGTQGVDDLNKDIDARIEDYDSQLKAARVQGSEIRSAKRNEAKASYDERIAQARSEAEGKVNDALTEIQTAADSARTELETTSQNLAAQISSQVLGRPVAQG